MADALDGARSSGAEGLMGGRAARADAVRKILAALAPLGDVDRDAVLAAILRLERPDGDDVHVAGAPAETPEERRKRLDRERKAERRKSSAELPHSSADMSADNSGSVRGTSADGSAENADSGADMSPDVAPSLSGSSGILSPSGAEFQGNVPSASARECGTSADNEPFAMPDSWPAPEEARAEAVMVGVRDFESAWTKFVAHHFESGKVNSRAKWLALFRKWCVDERNRERRRPTTVRASGLLQPVPGKRAWTMGGAE